MKKAKLKKPRYCVFIIQRKKFTLSRIASITIDSGYNDPNTSRLKEQLIKGKNKAFIAKKNSCITLSFIPAVYQRMEQEIGCLWENHEIIKSEGIDSLVRVGEK